MPKTPICHKTLLCALLLLSALAAGAQKQQGKASFYGKSMHGARTASGARLDNDQLVCAHRTHPFGTLLHVANPDNGREVVVKVVDRGPFVRGRIIDLSLRAARELGILQKGVATVIVQPWGRNMIPFLPAPDDLPEIEKAVSPRDTSIVPIWQRRDSVAAFR